MGDRKYRVSTLVFSPFVTVAVAMPTASRPAQSSRWGSQDRELDVSRSGYYGWPNRIPSERSRRDQALRRRLVELHEKYLAMGLDSLYHLLRPEFGCSRKRVHRQIQLAGVFSVRRRVYKATTNSNHSHPIAPNLLMRNFSFKNRIRPGWATSRTSPPAKAGCIWQS